MTHTKKFIEDVIEGGWREGRYNRFEIDEIIQHANIKNNSLVMSALMQPSAWKACGKVRGWGENCSTCSETLSMHEAVDAGNVTWAGSPPCGGVKSFIEKDSTYYQHQFIDHLQDNKSIEEALEAITK